MIPLFQNKLMFIFMNINLTLTPQNIYKLLHVQSLIYEANLLKSQINRFGLCGTDLLSKRSTALYREKPYSRVHQFFNLIFLFKLTNLVK
jgi:hypothetical protein